MIQMTSEDQHLLRDLEALLANMEPGSEAMPAVVAALKDALRAERAVAYGVEVGPERYHATYSHCAGFPQSPNVLAEVLDEFLPGVGDPWGYFDPAHPAPSQRNQALRFRPLAETTQSEPPLYAPGSEPWELLGIPAEQWARTLERVTARTGSLYRRLGLDRMAQLRTLVCEGATLLGWVGAFRTEPFTERDELLLQSLTPALQRRLAMDTRLREAGLLGSALEAALEALGRPAWVVTATGRVVHTNKAGRQRLDEDARGLASQVRDCLRSVPGSGPLFSSSLRSPGLPDHFLVLDPGPPPDHTTRVRRLALRWALTAREIQVLEHVVQGETNKAIAAHLGCAERTVEVHVTHLLNKAQVESRSALISRFFQAA
ncbi:LuxR family transcriptional regulator [Myxococcaceae bacterium JPH2]|nr:LuxR family transcriptional regulator [Myxococcaceae bacterium JPH2]